MEHLQRAVPVLAFLNSDEILTFYKEKMGFDQLGWKGENGAIIGGNRAKVHFWKCDNQIHPKISSCYALL